jgi:hypothetical protein
MNRIAETAERLKFRAAYALKPHCVQRRQVSRKKGGESIPQLYNTVRFVWSRSFGYKICVVRVARPFERSHKRIRQVELAQARILPAYELGR